ncbi:DNA/RNA non-specific endonuclease [Halosquirtibacter xylanolyticus]|uniref:DNA/RNA non-specific endonuclease n=1 Tax=Halosquirtibacter xylanolyticus TaxID=3374599 RepID=UPI00374A6CA3|nr:DNA/RNA non-specific endonuclease [Prolixibacteraceae bacterium]
MRYLYVLCILFTIISCDSIAKKGIKQLVKKGAKETTEEITEEGFEKIIRGAAKEAVEEAIPLTKVLKNANKNMVTKEIRKVGFSSITELIQSNKFIVKSSNGRHKVFSKEGEQLATILVTNKNTLINTNWVSRGTKEAKLNTLLNTSNLIPNATYNANGAKYFTDELSRPTKAIMPSFARVNKVPRNKGMQRQAREMAIGKIEAKNYDGGHMIANSLGGISEGINIVPQAPNVNRRTSRNASKIAKENNFYAIEDIVRQNSKFIKNYTVQNVYVGTSRTPTKQIVSYELRGETVKHTILNQVFD